ncbi:MAG: AAA family ATPase [Planctomycetia bacterium]|nr:AAA family ATPase [Planctomycetia bacterium]
MNLGYFGLLRRPFWAEPFLSEGFCPTGPVESAREIISRCIIRQEGISVVTGDSGCGKTLLCRILSQNFSQDLDVVTLCGRNLTTNRILYQMILAQIGVPYQKQEESELRISLYDFLSSAEYSLRGLLIIIDEAQTLRLRILEELRQLMDAVFTSRNGVRLVLAGTHSLEEKLANPRLLAFSQRITSRCYLEPLKRHETEEFLRSQIISCGGKASLFSSEVCREIHRFSQGVPRVIQQLADHLLVTAFEQKQKKILPVLVETAWKSLQQIVDSPASGGDIWSMDSNKNPQENFEGDELSSLSENVVSEDSAEWNTVEFGELEEDGKELGILKYEGASEEEKDVCDQEFSQEKIYEAVNAAVKDASTVCTEEAWENITWENSEKDFPKENQEYCQEKFSEENPKEQVNEYFSETCSAQDVLREEDSPEEKRAVKDKKDTVRMKIYNSDYARRKNKRSGHSKFQEKTKFGSEKRTIIPIRAKKTPFSRKTDQIISRAYLENTVHSFSQLHRMLEALLKESSVERKRLGAPSPMWRQLHEMSVQVMEQMVRERFHFQNLEEDYISAKMQESDVDADQKTPSYMMEDREFYDGKPHSRKKKHDQMMSLLYEIHERLAELREPAEMVHTQSSEKKAEMERKDESEKESPYHPKTLLEDPAFAQILEELQSRKKYRIDAAESPEDKFLPQNMPQNEKISEDYLHRKPLRENESADEKEKKVVDRFYKILSQLKTLEIEE